MIFFFFFFFFKRAFFCFFYKGFYINYITLYVLLKSIHKYLAANYIPIFCCCKNMHLHFKVFNFFLYTFFAAQSSSRSLVVGWLVRWSESFVN